MAVAWSHTSNNLADPPGLIISYGRNLSFKMGAGFSLIPELYANDQIKKEPRFVKERWCYNLAVTSPEKISAAKLGLLALIIGAVGIAFAPIFVRLSELGPSATGFHRMFLALPVLWLWAGVDSRRGVVSQATAKSIVPTRAEWPLVV